MAASSSSNSSFASSTLGRPPTYSSSYTSPLDSTWTPTSTATSGISTVISAPSIRGAADPQTPIQSLDLGPPGYQAVITLFQDTSDERTVYLGPWEVVGSENRRVLWQCSYERESLEHYLPYDAPSDIHPYTLHSKHHKYFDPADVERYVTFTEPHRIRYTNEDGVCTHDQYISVKYEFTTIEGSTHFQGDLRRRDLVDFYDADVIWTNVHGRTDRFGKVKGIGAIQRLKLWRDRYTTYHSLSVWANKLDGPQQREYDIHLFEGEVRRRENDAREVRLNVLGARRGNNSTDDHHHRQRRVSIADRMRPRARPTTSHSGQLAPESQSSSASLQSSPDLRYLSIQFTHRADFRRFLDRWLQAHSSDREFQGIPFPPNHFELPSPQIGPSSTTNLPSPEGQ